MRVYQQRRMIERMEARRNAQVAGIFANSNYDAQKEGQSSPRQEILMQTEESFQEEVRRVMLGTTLEKEEKEADEQMAQNPFFRSARRAMGE